MKEKFNPFPNTEATLYGDGRRIQIDAAMTPTPLDAKPQGALIPLSEEVRICAGNNNAEYHREWAERIEKLEGQCETYRNAANEAHRLLQTTYDERDTALRALAEARRDAERYRWLRDKKPWPSGLWHRLNLSNAGYWNKEIDYLRDAARQPEKDANNG